MNNSPYIQAYEAGIKLAVAQHFGKVANEEERAMLMEQYYDAAPDEQEAIANQIAELEAGEYAVKEPATSPFPSVTSILQKAEEQSATPSPRPAPQSRLTENTGPGILSREYRDQNDTLELADARLTDIEQQNTPTMLRGIPQPQASRRAPAPQPPQAQAPSPRFTEDDRLAINQQNAMAGMEPLRAEPSELARIPNFPSISDRRALNQATAQKAQDRRDEAEMDGLLEDDAARGNVEDDQTFGAVRGGYGKQLRALRGMGGLSEDARDLLGQTNYRQLASAMGDRGLRVGDQFNVQDLLGRLRGQQARRDQEAGGGGSIGSTAAPIQIQNRRGRDVSRGAITPRPVAPRPPTARPNVKSMVNQLGIAPYKPSNLGPAPTQEELLRSVGANPSTRRPRRGQDLMGGLQGFPSDIGQF